MDHNIDVYRLICDTTTHPYRARVNGVLLRTKGGLPRRYQSMAHGIKAAKAELCRQQGILI